jgi:hypothetical protein
MAQFLADAGRLPALRSPVSLPSTCVSARANRRCARLALAVDRDFGLVEPLGRGAIAFDALRRGRDCASSSNPEPRPPDCTKHRPSLLRNQRNGAQRASTSIRAVHGSQRCAAKIADFLTAPRGRRVTSDPPLQHRPNR